MTATNRSSRLAAWAFLSAATAAAVPCAAKVALPAPPPPAPPAQPAPAAQPANPQPAPAKPADAPPAGAQPAKPVLPALQPKPAADPAKPAEPPKVDENILRAYRQQRDNARQQVAGVQEMRDATIAKLIRFSQVKGVIRLETTLPPMAGQLGQNQQRLKIPGINAGWTFSRYQNQQSVLGPNGRVMSVVQSVSVQRVELDGNGDNDVYQTSVSASGSNLTVSSASVLGRVTFSQNTALRNNAVVAARVGAIQPVTLTVTEMQGRGQMKQVFRGTARTVDELRARFPDEFRKHLMPALARVSDLAFLQPGATDVYSVFAEVPADPRATAKVEALLPELDSDAFPVREAASKQLLELGGAAVAAALRLDRDALTDEQKGQLGKLIGQHRRRDVTDYAEARKDPTFLADCLEHDDPSVRAAAEAKLEAVLGVPVAFDPSATGPAMGESADAVRKQVQEIRAAAAAGNAATQPATQPVGEAAPRPAVRPGANGGGIAPILVR